jgi:hypothetical protein
MRFHYHPAKEENMAAFLKTSILADPPQTAVEHILRLSYLSNSNAAWLLSPIATRKSIVSVRLTVFYVHSFDLAKENQS